MPYSSKFAGTKTNLTRCHNMELKTIINRVVDQFPEEAEQAKDRPYLIGWFVAQVMKETEGKANPNKALAYLEELFGEEEEIHFDAELHMVNIVKVGGNHGPAKVAYGIIANDKKARFFDGDSVRTSQIRKVKGDYIYTMNTVYKVMSWRLETVD
uniref:Asn/Gln amidotransferase domain-containing protein n=1 Tax=Ochrobactrum phage ORM_20 TaxID=2985243 RepID=A0A9N6WU15_9VIRU|nr:hypothetical protein ORM20_00141 [Ochrobactrum phage ORM_20]